MSETYTRLYHKVAREFASVWSDDHLLAWWMRLLMVADASWPMRPPLPRALPTRTLSRLIDEGLVIRDGDAYTVRGLDAERTRRSETGRNAAAKRWQSERNANASADAMPSRAEQNKAEITPPPQAGLRSNGTNPRALGTNPRAKGTSPRQERERVKRDPTPIHEILRRAALAGTDS